MCEQALSFPLPKTASLLSYEDELSKIDHRKENFTSLRKNLGF